jgi:hypothetical protein
MDFVDSLLGMCIALLPVVLMKVLTTWLSDREVRKLLDEEDRERYLWYKAQVEGGRVPPYDAFDVSDVNDWR